MTSDELPDVPLSDAFLLFAVLLEPRRLRRIPKHQLTGIHHASETLEPLIRLQRPKLATSSRITSVSLGNLTGRSTGVSSIVATAVSVLS